MSKKTSKSQRAAIAAKRKRMGLSAVDQNDADDGTAYDPQLITISKNKIFLTVFEKKAGSLHASVSFDEFRECLELLDIAVPSSDARKAFKELDFENEDELEFEPFVHAVFVANPKYNLIWNDIMKKKKYYHFRTIEGPYSESQLKSILKNKFAEFNDKMTALRCILGMVGAPEIKDKQTKEMMVKVLPGILAALRSKNQTIVREACLTIALIAKSKKSNLKTFVSKILNICWELFDSTSELVKYSATMASKCLLKYVPDSDDNAVLKTLVQGTLLKDYKGVQSGCYEGIKTYLKKAGNPKAKKKPNKGFWELMKKVINDGLKSTEKLEKQRAYECLIVLEKSSPKKSARITTAFTVKQNKEISNVKNGKDFDDINSDDDKDDDDNDNKADDLMSWQADPSKRGPKDLSRDYDERKEELIESFDAYDDEGEGWLSTDRATQYLRDLFDCTGVDADIALRGLDNKFDGHIMKNRMINWSMAHSWKKVKNNKYLINQGKKYGYASSRKQRLQQRLELYTQLKDIETAEHNYPAIYDIDHRMCIINYYIKNSKK